MRLLALFFGLAIFAQSVSANVTAQERGIAEFPKLSASRDWPWWRGPTRNGFAAAATNVPTKFDEQSNVAWRVAVPGRGHSSPTVVGEQIFLATADEEKKVHSVLAFRRGTGEALWTTEISRGGFPAHNHPKNTEATTTIACDGDRLFATFFHHEMVQLTALDLQGKILWQKKAGAFNPKRYEYGYAPSPLIYRGTVIIAGEYDGDSFLAAFDRVSGEEKWRTPRPRNTSFSSPVVGHVAGKDQLLISGADQITSYDPASGKQLWTTRGTTAATCGTLVWDQDIVFASGGYPTAGTFAVQGDGSKVLWQNNQKCYEQSLLAHNGYVYGLTDGGVIYCWRGADGKEMWKERLQGPVSASPVFAGGNIYWANELGMLYVFRATPETFTLVAKNQIGSDSFPSPAICGNQIFLRVADKASGKRQEYLYCFQNPERN